MKNIEFEKSRPYLIVEMVEYLSNAILTKNIVQKPTGNVSVHSFDTGEQLAVKPPPFDSFVQIVEGNADLTINNKKYELHSGEGIIIPAHLAHNFHAAEPFKMISTIIKSGYEE